MRRPLACALSTALLIAGTMVPVAADAAAPHRPNNITKVSARPGPGVGQITLSWRQDGRYTTGYQLETGLSSFSKTNSKMSKSGRKAKVFAISRSRRSVTLSAAQLASAGASVNSGNRVYYRFRAINKTKSGTSTRDYPYLQAIMPRPVQPKTKGTKVRVATFNVRTAKGQTGKQSWLHRAPAVAKQTVSRNPGVVAVQELGPGRADGKSGSTTGTIRQTNSLHSALKKAHGSKYRLVRTTPYIKPGKKHGSQGQRILYDSSRYALRSSCPEKSKGGNYSGSCTIQMPKLSSDSETVRRKAAYAEFSDRKTGARFFLVSAHLDTRHSSSAKTERRYDALRASQTTAINTHLTKINTARRPVIVAGDLNSWQNNRVANGAHDALIRAGYYDTVAALTRVNLKYSTYNQFAAKQPANPQGFGSQLDQILVKGVKGAQRFENVTRATNSSRPSDHNLVLADLVL